MSARSLFEDLYFDQQHEMTRLREQKGELQIKLIQCESQRSSLVFLILSTARSLEENHFPQLAGLLRQQVARMEEDYACSQGVPRSAVAGRSAHEAGSSSVPEAAKELESPQALPVSDRSPRIPTLYSGEWDEVKS